MSAMTFSARDRLIVALDVSSAAEARKIVAAVGESATTFKVGKQLFTAEGPGVVRDLVASGRKVFLDLKFHDIPNTVAKAVREACALKVAMLNVHASGGSKMLKAAAEAVASSPHKPMLLAVTVLTSFSDADVLEVGFGGRVLDEVLRLTTLARAAGCDGIVTSAQEAREVRRQIGTGFPIVTPGVRPAGSAKGDQERVVTPAEALAAGVTYIVVGRPITAAPDPAAAAKSVLKEMEEAAVGC